MVARNAQQGLTRYAECLSLFIKTGHIQFNELREAIYVATSLHSIDLARALINQPTLYQQGNIPDFSIHTDRFHNYGSNFLSLHEPEKLYIHYIGDGRDILNERNSAKSTIIKFLGQMLIEGSVKIDVEDVICKEDRQIPQLQRDRERGLKNTHNRLRMIVTGLQSRGIDASIINKIIHGMREEAQVFPFALPAERRNLMTKMVEQLTS